MAELIDLVDKTGVIVKPRTTRNDLATFPNLHMQIVIVVLIRDKQLLVHARSKKKKVNPGDIDHVCGGILAGETPQEAAIRETDEETGIKISKPLVIARGINEYNRYRYLLVTEVKDEPIVQDPDEVEWVRYMPIDELRKKAASGELTFVTGFFDDLDEALAANHQDL